MTEERRRTNVDGIAAVIFVMLILILVVGGGGGVLWLRMARQQTAVRREMDRALVAEQQARAAVRMTRQAVGQTENPQRQPATDVQAESEVDLPAVMIALSADGQLSTNDGPLPMQQLRESIRQHPDAPFTLQVDDQCPFHHVQSVFAVFDELQHDRPEVASSGKRVQDTTE